MAERLRVFVAISLGVASIALMFALMLLFRAYRIPTAAMEPTVHAGEHVLTRRASSAQRGDLIAFRYPLKPDTTFMKRVVALPGETVEIRDKQLFVNGRAVDEPYVIHDDPELFPRDPRLPEPYKSRDQYGPYVVPPNT